MNLQDVLKLDEKFQFFSEEKREEEIKECEDFLNDPEKKAALEEVIEKLSKCNNTNEMKQVKVPDDDLFRFLAVASTLDRAVEFYVSRNFGKDEAMGYLQSLRGCIRNSRAKTGRFGLNPLYYNWFLIFSCGQIFKIGDKEIECRHYIMKTIWLRNKETKEIRGVKMDGAIHKNGHVYGNAPYTEADGKIDITFEETDEYILGHSNFKNLRLIDLEPTKFLKSEWDVLLRPDEDVLAFHFPKNANLKTESLNEFFRVGKETVLKYFPDFKPKCYFCTSWLLDPAMREMLPETSNIYGFQKLMTSFPFRTNGDDVFGYVFNNQKEPYEELPENSSLQRNIKAYLLKGDKIYSQIAVRPFDLCV